MELKDVDRLFINLKIDKKDLAPQLLRSAASRHKNKK